MQQLIISLEAVPGALVPEKNGKNNIQNKKTENCKYFIIKIAKIRVIKNLKKHFITSRDYAVSYYQILDEVPLLLRLEEPKNFKKLENCKFEKLLKFVIIKS